MFPISHFYIASKVLGKKSGGLALGSTLPDIRVALKDNSPLDSLNNQTGELAEFIIKRDSNLEDVVIGMRLHTVQKDFKGADHYSDDRENGYAIVQGEKIRQEVGALINDWGRNNQVLAHSFIEAALALKLQEYDKTIGLEYDQLMHEIDITEIVSCLAEFYKMDPTEVRENLKKLGQFFSLKNMVSATSFAKMFVIPTEKRYGVKLDNLLPLVDLIEESCEIINDSYVEFYESTIEKIGKDWMRFNSLQ